MSISEQISSTVSDGRLFPIKPKSRGRSVLRYMFVSQPIRSAIDSPPEGDFERFDELHADLVSFVVDRYITPDFLWLLTPPNEAVWEIRSRRTEPQIRVFGHFAEKDVFVALTYNYRAELGAFEDPNWNYERRKARAEWRNLFPGYDPKTTSSPDKLFTGALNEKYFR